MKKILLPIFFFACLAASFAQDRKREIQAFATKNGAIPAFSKATGSVNMLRFSSARAINLSGANPNEKALAFLKQNARLFAMNPKQDVYLLKQSRKDQYGFEHIEMQQFYKGIPVFDGTLKFHFNKNNALSSVNGNFIPVEALNTIPAFSSEEAASEAIKLVKAGKKSHSKNPLKVKANKLFVFQKGLIQGYPGKKHLVYEVEVENGEDVRELVYLDAHTKALVEQFEGMNYIKRRILDADNGTTKWKEGDPTTSLSAAEKTELAVTGQFYNLMKNTFDYTSYDDKDAEMNFAHITEYPGDDIFSAWNGSSVVFYSNSAVDDIITHEWAHAYTQYTTGLIYEWESGSINEAYSDIWGETLDQINGYMDEGENNAVRTAVCGSSTRWVIGEKADSDDNLTRDMWNPNCTGTPGKISDPQYLCASRNEFFGKNVNYSVLSHAYALLVDGGTYNGQTIKGIGLTKAAHIFWHAQKNYVTRTTGFSVMADILEASASDLVGVNLPALSTAATAAGLSGQSITADDVQQVSKVIAAVELRMPNDCFITKIFSPVDTICAGASKEHAIFYEDFESGLANWTLSNTGVNASWAPHNWVVAAKSPGLGHGKVAFGIANFSNDCNDDTNLQNGLISMTSPVITIPAGSTGNYNLAFDHYVALDSVLNGGNIRYKINGGTWILVPATAFTHNGYNGVLRTRDAKSANPLQGQQAFTDTDIGPVWGQSRIDLSLLGLTAGQTIQLRWDLGTYRCSRMEGWYIDNITVYSCSVPSIQFLDDSSYVRESEAEIEGSESCLRYVEKVIRVKLNAAPSAPVTVTMNTPAGNAENGPTADYTFSPASFVLKEGQLLQDVTVRIYDDAYVEGNENIVFSYTFSGGNAFAETTSQRHLLKIVDNDAEPLTGNKELFSEDFSNGLPAGWKISGGYTFPYTWGIINQQLLVSRSEYNEDIIRQYDETIETATFNTAGLTNIKLSFKETFFFIPSFPQSWTIEVWDGGTWQNLLSREDTTQPNEEREPLTINELEIPASYANSEMKLRFNFKAQLAGYWIIDDIKITAGKKVSVANTVSENSSAQYLGPNATAYFYDPESGNLQAKIKNLSDHDYGCTTVEIDRSGKDTTAWIGGYQITKKTFLVTPANNNPAGNYEITLYYRASELQNFSGSDILSMGKSEGGIGNANTVSNSTAEMVQQTGFGSDYAYTATFHTGFSGFGLSNAPAGPLPVTLSRFEGKPTAEGNLLSWTTTLETNNAYFLVERSMDSRIFMTAGKVEAIKGDQAEKNYRFLDTDFVKGMSYYRLKQVDTDSKSVHSRIIAIDAANSAAIKLYPNPVQKEFTLELPETGNEKVQIKLVNAAGRQVFVKEQAGNQNGKISIDIEKLPAGIYQVIVTGKNKSWVLPVLKM